MADTSGISSTPSGMTGAGGGNMIRITGMASGLDVDAMVKKMMIPEQTKLDKAKQQQQLFQWKQESYQDTIKDIKDLQSSFFDATSADKNILSATNFSPFNVNGVGISTVDTTVATFIPGVGAQSGKYSVTVNKLAAGAGLNNILNGKVLNTKLTDLGSLPESINLALTVGTSDVNITLDNTSGNATIGDLVNAINTQGGGTVKASFSELTGQFKLNTVATGSNTSLTIKAASTADLSNILGNGKIGSTFQGSNADVTIQAPGSIPVTFNDLNGNAKTTNNFTIDGMNYVLSSESPKDNTNTPIATAVNVSPDTDKVYDKIKSFIDKYNTIVDEIQTKLTEKKDNSYAPLTDAQKASMSSSQITSWETKAKAGILRNDDNLNNLLNDLRTAFTSAVSNSGLSLGSYGSNSFGIDTSKDYTKPAHIDIVDSSKLKAAISNNSDQIMRIFTNVSQAADGATSYNNSKTQYQEDGIFTRIKHILENNVGYTNTTFNSAILTSFANKQYDYSSTGSGGKGTLPDQIYEQQLMVKKITDEMSTKQEQYYKQFSQLETALTQLNSQQASLTSMLGG